MSSLSFVCLTADIWSTRHRSFLGVTAHWVSIDIVTILFFLIKLFKLWNETNYNILLVSNVISYSQINDSTMERIAGALACRRFKGDHTYLKISELLDDIMNEYSISISNVVSTVTDNGSNFVKAFREFGIKSIDALIKDSESDSENEYDATNDPVDRDSNELEIASYEDEDSQELGPTPSLPNHVRCASHTLSLVATTDAKKVLKAGKFSSLNHSTMAKCSGLWNKSGKPKSAEIIKDILGIQLRLPCPTRWNSLYDSLHLLLAHKDKLHNLMTTLSFPPFKNVEIDFLGEYVIVLEPIATAIDRLQGEKDLFYGELLPTLLTVEKKLFQLQSTHLKYCTPLLLAVSQGFMKRFKQFLNLDNEPQVSNAVLASVSHPYFKLRWLATVALKEGMSTHKEEYVKNMFLRVARSISTEDVNSESSLDSDGEDYFGFPKRNNSIETSKCMSIEGQVLAYLNDKSH